MRRFKANLYRYIQSFMRLPILFCVATIAVLVWVQAERMRDIFSYKFGGFSTADIVTFMFDGVTFVPPLIVLTVFAVCVIIHNDFSSQFCLHYNSRLDIFIDQIKKTALFCFLVSLFIHIEEFIYATVNSVASFSNFSSKQSAFYYVTKHLMKEQNVFFFCFASIVSMFLILFISSLIILSSKWLFDNYFAGFFIIVSDIAICLVGDEELFFVRLSFNYGKWYDKKLFFTALPVPIIITAILICITFAAMKRREFTDGKK